MSGIVEILFTFDTTGSMYPCLTQLRRNIVQLLATLRDKTPGIRLAVLAHGDYGDTYVTKSIDLTTDTDALMRFVNEVESTGGGDWAECYELVLREAHTKFTWTPGAERAVVMIGDAVPLALAADRNLHKIDWHVEAAELLRQGFRFYAVQAMDNREAEFKFWQPLARETNGMHLKLNQFSEITEMLLAICQHVNGGAAQVRVYRDELCGRAALTRTQARMFAQLTGDAVAEGAGALTAAGLTPVPPARFQALLVGHVKISIRDFALEQGLPFRTGHGFYEMTKPEVISDKKEVVLQDTATGDMFTGADAKAHLGPNVGSTTKVRPPADGKYRVFVQSTSVNRVLEPGSHFLYEVTD